MATDVAPGTRAVSRHGKHNNREVLVTGVTNAGSVQYVVVPGTGASSHGIDPSKRQTVSAAVFAERYVVSSNGTMTPAPAATATRWRRATPKPQPKLPAAPKPFTPATGLIKPGKTDLNIEVIEITPSLAQAWLARSTEMINRPVHLQWVQQLMQAIRRGEWQLTGDSIKMDAQGQVVDGQHRLLAIAQSGVSCLSLVVRGVHPAAFAVMDTGRGRTVGDILHLYGITDRFAKAGMVRILLLLEATGRPVTGTLESRGIVSPASTLAYLEQHPDIDQGAKMADSVRQVLEGGKGIWGAAFVLLMRVDRPAVEKFAYLLRTGEDLSRGNPILLLRRRTEPQKSAFFARDSRAREELMALIIKAWNAWRSGETIETLRWRGQARKPEAFPVPI